jgi:hypothetical protein
MISEDDKRLIEQKTGINQDSIRRLSKKFSKEHIRRVTIEYLITLLLDPEAIEKSVYNNIESFMMVGNLCPKSKDLIRRDERMKRELSTEVAKITVLSTGRKVLELIDETI